MPRYLWLHILLSGSMVRRGTATDDERGLVSGPFDSLIRLKRVARRIQIEGSKLPGYQADAMV
jgi:hypothetical protein